jgi:hypothetical protein
MSEHHFHKDYPSEFKVSFQRFLEKFPVVDLPVTLGENTHHEFITRHEDLPAPVVDQFISRIEGNVPDELTEFVPCFRLPDNKDFFAIVYWRAGLMDYRYVLTTLNPKGEKIDMRVIAGMYSDGKLITQSVATIDVDWSVTIMTGQTMAGNNHGEHSESRISHLEIQNSGKIEHV